ncbi:MAG: glycosyltransferase [Desulfovibrionaceae bacterium]
MNIACVNATHSWGGVKTWTLEVADFLRRRGHGVWLFGRPGPFVDKARALGIDARPVSFGFDFNPVCIARFAAFFWRNKVDVVLGNVAKDMRSAGVAARLCGIPVVQRIGAQGDLSPTAKIRFQMRLVRPHLLTNCHDIKHKLAAKLPFVAPGAITVIHPGKPPVAAPPPARVAPDAPLALIATNQLVAGKDMPALLHALAMCRDAGHAFTLHVVGNGNQEAPLKALAQTLGLAERIVWHGFSTDVPGHLRRADVFCLSSPHEGVPQGLLEAMAHGLVPVARRVGGIPEVWPAGLDHLLVDPASGPAGLAQALSSVLAADNATLAAWKRLAWEKCVADCNISIQAAALEAWLAALATRR